MKVSVLTQIVGGASVASAAACRHIQVVPFTTKFEVVTLEDAQAAAADDPGFIEYLASLRPNVTAGINDTLSVGPVHTYPTSYPTASLSLGVDVDVDAAGINVGLDASADIDAAGVKVGLDVDVGLGLGARANAKKQENIKNANTCANPAVRVEWRNMKPKDKESFVKAVRCLMDKPPSGLTKAATNRYEELVWAHQTQVNDIHMAGSFLPWHRYYTHLLSRLIREECGYTAPFPWWDETKDAGNYTASGLFTRDYFGSLPAVTKEGHGSCVTDGAFAGKMLHIGPGEENTEHCLSRGEDKAQTINVSKAYVDTCNSRTAYADMRSCMEFGPHAYGHNGVGPVMAEVSGSPGDPVFFMHHAFIDRNWKVWQDKNETRRTTVSGCATPGDPCTPMTTATVLSSKGIRPNVTIEEVLDTQNSWLCYTYDY